MLRSLMWRNSGENGAPGGTLFSQVQGLVKPKVKPYCLQLIWTGRGFKTWQERFLAYHVVARMVGKGVK